MAPRKRILVVGLPRSGSSWVGAVLGASLDVEYLREPITQLWIKDGLRNTSVDPAHNAEYADLSERMMATAESVVVKEVNTFLVPHFIDHDDLQIVLLHRHPCAVALSHWERKWKRLDMAELFGEEETGDFWFDHGRLQALLMRPALKAIQGKGLIVSYDELTRQPEEEYERLAGRLGLTWDEAAIEHLRSTLGEGRPTDPYSISRDLAIARDRWMARLGEVERDAVLAGYRSVKLRGLPRPTATGYQSRKLMYWRGKR